MTPFTKRHFSFEENIIEAKRLGVTIIMANPFPKKLKNLGFFTIQEMHTLIP